MNERRTRMKKGFDGHCHFRKGEMLTAVAPYIKRMFTRAVAMPNTVPAIKTGDDAQAYKQEITRACGDGFEPVMAIMLTKCTARHHISDATRMGVRLLKYIPEGVSTNSNESVPIEELRNYYPVLDMAQEVGMVFSGHWESLYADTRLYGSGFEMLPEVLREEAAIRFLADVVNTFPGLKIVIPHASTKRMIDFAKQCPANVRVELTVQHAMLTYGDVCTLNGTVYSPHNYCKPIAKGPEDVAAVISAMISGDPRFFFGSDFAPHLLSAKVKYPPAAGICNPFALCDLCWIFDKHDALDKLEGFITRGEELYGLEPSSETIELVKEDWPTPETIPCGSDVIIPFRPGAIRHWRIA